MVVVNPYAVRDTVNRTAPYCTTNCTEKKYSTKIFFRNLPVLFYHRPARLWQRRGRSQSPRYKPVPNRFVSLKIAAKTTPQVVSSRADFCD